MECIEELLENLVSSAHINNCRTKYNTAINNYDKKLGTYKEILLELLRFQNKTETKVSESQRKSEKTDEYNQLKHQIASTMIDIKNKTQTLYIQ